MSVQIALCNVLCDLNSMPSGGNLLQDSDQVLRALTDAPPHTTGRRAGRRAHADAEGGAAAARGFHGEHEGPPACVSPAAAAGRPPAFSHPAAAGRCHR